MKLPVLNLQLTVNNAKVKKQLSKGFSLTELLVVIAIIAIISAVGVSVNSSVQKNTRDAQREADLRVIQGALQQYYADQNFYPNILSSVLSAGGPLTNCSGRPAIPACTVSKTYLTSMPRDPSGTAYGFQSLTNANSSQVCDITGGFINVCHFYYLCAKKEGLAVGNYCGSNNNYNFRISPL